MSTSAVFVLLTAVITPLGLRTYRRDYARYGRTTPWGVALLLAAWFMPMCVLGYGLPWVFPPQTTMQWVGWSVTGASAALCAVPLHQFGPKRVVGLDTSRLVTTGIYRFSRNPQYVLSFFFPLGYALTGWSLMAWLGVGLMWMTIHATARIEEEHLDRQFGEEYRRYKDATPRYLFR